MYFLSIIVLCCFIIQIFSRPSQILEDYDKEAKEDSFEDSNKSYSDDYLHNDSKSALKQFSDNEPNNLQDVDGSNWNEEINRARSDKDYLEDSANQAKSAQLSQNHILLANNDIKRTAEYNEGNGLLFQNNEKQRKDFKNTNEYNEIDNFGDKEQIHFQKSNVMHNVNIDTDTSDINRFISSRDSVCRDRRQAKESDSNESIDTDEISTRKSELNTDEDEETAIRKHMKKLSKVEIDELFNSLSEDKRELLKNIIENSQEINKREITKKAGASEENNFVSSEQSDSSKIQSGTANIEADAAMSKLESTNKASSETVSSKSTEIVNSSEKTVDKRMLYDVEDTKLDKSDNKESLDALQKEITIQSNTDSELIKSKNGKKREINYKSSINTETKDENSEMSNSLNTEDVYCSGNEDLSQLWDESSYLYHDSDNMNKREISPDKSVKSLEDSFPNTEDISDTQSGSDTIPLVRVKRTNFDKNVEKRDASLIPNLKVPFFSNAINDNEEDNDEGSEFQDDGVFDRRSNFDKSGELNGQDTKSTTAFNDINLKNSDQDNQPVDMALSNEKIDTESLGSDTDAVLSGIEGVNDNLMYSSVSRNKRTVDKSKDLNNEDDKLEQRNMPKLVPDNENNQISEPCYNAPRYQENDAFGSLPRNHERDPGRFKRIRRLKPLITVESNATNHI